MIEEKCIEHLKRVDLNSVVFFIAIMNYRTVYNTGLVMNCSSPTVSIMLKRFCSYFPVPLFEREGRCLIPTKHAIDIYRKIEGACIDLDTMFTRENYK